MIPAEAELAVRNQRILTAWDARQADDARRAAAGLPPKTRRRRRKTLAALPRTRPPLILSQLRGHPHSTAGITKTTARRATTCCPEQPRGQGSNQPARAASRPNQPSGHIRKMSGSNVNMDTGET